MLWRVVHRQRKRTGREPVATAKVRDVSTIGRRHTPPQQEDCQDAEDQRKKQTGTFQIPVDSFNETSGGGRMVIATSNRYDSSTSTTNQRQNDEVYETP